MLNKYKIKFFRNLLKQTNYRRIEILKIIFSIIVDDFLL